MNTVEEQLRKYYMYRECEPDSPEYQSSLDIYLTLGSLYRKGKIDSADIKIVDCIISGYSYRSTARIVRVDRRSLAARYQRVLSLLEEALKEESSEAGT